MAGMEISPIFEDDIVEMIYKCKKNGILKRKVGTILESSQNISSDEEDEDNDSFYQNLRKNTVRVAWHPSGHTEVIEESKLNILERSLLPGDIVARMSNGQESQKGYVTNCKMSCVLQCLNQPFIIFDVDSSHLVDFLPFHSENQQVYLDGWVGNVDRISERVVLKFADGARCELNTEELVGNLMEFYDVNDRRDKSSEFFTNSFYVGQLLKGEMGFLEGCTWLEQTKTHSNKAVRKNKHKNVMVTIEVLEVHSVDVMWLCRGYSEASSSEEVNRHPPSVISGKDLEKLKVLDFFQACDYALGSKAYYTTRMDDRIINGTNKEDVRNEFISAFNSRELATSNRVVESECESSESKVSVASPPNSNASLPTDNKAVEVELVDVNSNPSHSPSKPAVTGKKSGGTTQANARSQTSVTSLSRKVHKHQRAQGGKPSKKKKISQKINFGRFGKKVETLEVGTRVAAEIVALHSRVDVLWQDGTREANLSSGDLLPVQYVDNLEFFPGDYVSPAHPSEHLSINNYGVIQKVNHMERTCIIQWYALDNGQTGSPSMECLGDKEEVSVFDIKEHPDLRFRPGDMIVRVGGFGMDSGNSTVGGQVLESGVDGRLLVHWADGSQSFCKPVDVFLVTSEISDVGSSGDESDYSDTDDDELDRYSAGSAASWEWQTEEEVDDDELADDSNVLADKKLDRHGMIQELDVGDLERNVSFFSVAKSNMEQNLITLASILTQEKPVEIRKIASSPTEGHSTVVAKPDASLPRLIATSEFEGSCDFDGFMAVVLDLSNLHRTMYKLDNARFVVTWLSMKKYLEAVQEQLRKAKTYNMCRKTFARAKFSFEANSKMIGATGSKEEAVAATASAKDDKSTDGPTPVEEPQQTLNLASLFKVFDAIRPDRSPYDIIRMFHSFVESLGAEFDECHRLCVESLKSKQAFNDVNFIDAPLCKVEGTPVDPEKSEETFKDVGEEFNDAVTAVLAGEMQPLVVPVKSDLLSQGFLMLEIVPESHYFKKNSFSPTNSKAFCSAVKKETTLLETCLPKGIHVRGFESRMDLFSGMIEGPTNTPYEDGLFFFDVQLSADYPKSPPKLHYISYCSDRLNPNLYEDGKVCVSLLGTWSGRGTEMWNPSESNLLQILVSIQGLILNQEPYYNEAGYEKQKGSIVGMENCRMYNEMVIIKMVQAMTRLLINPYDIFEGEIVSHMQLNSERFVDRLKSWSSVDSNTGTPEKKSLSPDIAIAGHEVVAMAASAADAVKEVPVEEEAEVAMAASAANAVAVEVSRDVMLASSQSIVPGFPLFPVSKGFKITLSKCLDQFVSAATSKSILSNH